MRRYYTIGRERYSVYLDISASRVNQLRRHRALVRAVLLMINANNFSYIASMEEWSGRAKVGARVLTRSRNLAQVSAERSCKSAEEGEEGARECGYEDNAAAALHPDINFRANPGVSASCPHTAVSRRTRGGKPWKREEKERNSYLPTLNHPLVSSSC